MDIETLHRYLVIIREGTISRAAEVLHISQPALSRQMKDLEDNLGVTLFERGHRHITLTHEGMILRKRAEEMIKLVELTENEINQAKSDYAGDIYIGAGESHAFHYISQVISEMRHDYPDIHFHIISGDTKDLLQQIEHGLIDFALIFTDYDHSSYHAIELPMEDYFGVLLRKDHPLTNKEEIAIEDLYDYPLIISRASDQTLFPNHNQDDFNIVATYNLIYNASLLVEDNVGIALGFDHLINVTGDSPLCFRPTKTQLKTNGRIIWKKYQVFPLVQQLFIDRLKAQFNL